MSSVPDPCSNPAAKFRPSNFLLRDHTAKHLQASAHPPNARARQPAMMRVNAIARAAIAGIIVPVAAADDTNEGWSTVISKDQAGERSVQVNCD